MLQSDPSIQSAVEQLHTGSEAQRRAACDLLYRYWHNQLAAYVMSRCPGLTADRVVNAVNDAFLALLSAVNSTDYDPKYPQRLLFTVALRRAFDELRSQTKRGKWLLLTEEATVVLIEQAQDGGELRNGADLAEDSEMMEAIRKAIAAMPERQRHVAQLMVDHCNGPVTARIIQELARVTDGMYLTLPTANRALEEVKKKLRDVLVRFGHTPD